MAKKRLIARDEANVRKVRKTIRVGVPVQRVAPLDPDGERDRWLARNPNLVLLA